MKLVAAIMMVGLVGVGCGDDSSSKGDGGTVVDAASSVDAASGSCPFTGTYTLESYACGANDITAAWKTVIPTTTVTFSSAGTGCKLTLQYTSASCLEGEEALVTNLGATANYMWTGVTRCMPTACKHTANDAACMIGDRVEARTGALLAEGAKIRVRYNFMDNVCNGVEASIVLSK